MVGFRFLLDSLAGLHVADVTDSEAPAARDADGAAPLVVYMVTSDSDSELEGRWAAATWAGNLDAARAWVSTRYPVDDPSGRGAH